MAAAKKPTLKKGDAVTWTWGAHDAKGTVVAASTHRVERRIKGSKVVRNGSETEPVYDLRQDNGTKVLKSASELHKAKTSTAAKH